jgi:metallophosphoesterase (TIGR00282 family)
VKILAIGDVTSPAGVAHLEKNLWSIRRSYGIDFCIVNGENASFITGIGSEGAAVLLRSGADVITGGNHTMQNYGAAKMLENEPCVLRPINYGDAVVGRGYCIVDTGACRILTINALGCVHIDPVLDMPYSYIDRAIAEAKGKYDVAILDIHAEATGEKLAIAHNYDGIINVVFGTHTHVPTADLSVLPKGTGYVTDLGMCGESGGILGMDIDTVIYKMKTKLPSKFRACNGKPTADGVIFELDNTTFKVLGLKRIKF